MLGLDGTVKRQAGRSEGLPDLAFGLLGFGGMAKRHKKKKVDETGHVNFLVR